MISLQTVPVATLFDRTRPRSGRIFRTVVAICLTAVSLLGLAGSAWGSPRVGGSIVLHGFNGLRIKVTVLRVINPARGGEFDEPASGKKFVAIKLSLRNVGRKRYSDSPSNGAALIYSGDRQANATLPLDGPCAPLSNSTSIRPGGRRVGCVYFEIPRRSRPHLFQFTLDSGFANQTGEWRL